MSKKKIYHYVYITENLRCGTPYVGIHSTRNLDDGYIGSGTHLKRAIKKYGKDNFKMEIIAFYDTREEAAAREAQIVNEHWVGDSWNYNLAVGGSWGSLGYKHTEEARAKMSEANSGEKNPMFGKKLSDEIKRKMSESSSGDKNPMFGLKGEKSPNYGRTHSKETKRKMSEALSGEKNPKAKAVLHLPTGLFFDYLKEGCEALNQNYSTAHSRIRIGSKLSEFIYI